jgi:NTP pyrophosphatase (non-canonical NTP hydrolase)
VSPTTDRQQSLSLDDYQKSALRTSNDRLTDAERLMDAAAGLAEEGGEVLGLVRKHLYMGHEVDRARLATELGDALWCVAAVASALGLTMSEVAGGNLEKLARRYPDGYTNEGSRGRAGG